MRKKKILIIDDDEMNLQIAKMILEKKLPCEVICADNGIDGLDILRKQRVTLVLLDILMPVFDGIETLQEIRDNPQTKDIEVMMLTASGEIENIQKVGALGVKDYIKKPFMPADLVSRVAKKIAGDHSEEVLLIGDNETVLQDMRKIIEENFPHEVEIAATYKNALEILNDAKIKLIISFSGVKFVFGFKIMGFLASDDRFKEIPFVLLTPEKLLEMIDKINQLKAEESPAEEVPDKDRFWAKPSKNYR